MRCRSIVALIALPALLAPADWAAAQRGGRGGHPGSDVRGQPPAPILEEKPPDRPATNQGTPFGFAMPKVLEAIDRGRAGRRWRFTSAPPPMPRDAQAADAFEEAAFLLSRSAQ